MVELSMKWPQFSTNANCMYTYVYVYICNKVVIHALYTHALSEYEMAMCPVCLQMLTTCLASVIDEQPKAELALQSAHQTR